jgi:hypothetical protein
LTVFVNSPVFDTLIKLNFEQKTSPTDRRLSELIDVFSNLIDVFPNRSTSSRGFYFRKMFRHLINNFRRIDGIRRIVAIEIFKHKIRAISTRSTSSPAGRRLLQSTRRTAGAWLP